MLGDVGLIDYIDMQRDISNKPSLSVLVLREAGATEHKIAAVACIRIRAVACDQEHLNCSPTSYYEPLHITFTNYNLL